MGLYFFLNISTPHISIHTDQYKKYVHTILLNLNCTDYLYKYCKVKKKQAVHIQRIKCYTLMSSNCRKQKSLSHDNNTQHHKFLEIEHSYFARIFSKRKSAGWIKSKYIIIIVPVYNTALTLYWPRNTEYIFISVSEYRECRTL